MFSQVRLRKILDQLKFEPGGLKNNFAHKFLSKGFTVFLSFAITPVLARLYSPLDYGVLGVYNSIALNFSILSSLGYIDGMGVSSNDKDFYALQKLSLFTSTFFAVIIVPVMPFLIRIFDHNNDAQAAPIVVIIWSGALLLSASNILIKMNMHYNDFAFGSKSGVISNVVLRSFALVGGFYPSKLPFGLMIAELAHKLTLLLAGFIRHGNRLRENWKAVGWKDILNVAKSYLAYPKYYLPSRYLSVIIAQIPIFYIAKFHSLSDLGHYTMAASLVVLPINVFGNSLSAIYIRRFRSSNVEEIGELTIKLFNFLKWILIVPVLLLMIFGSDLVVFILGARWQSSGLLIQAMSIYLIYQTFFVSVSGLFQLINLEKAFLKFQLVSFLAVILFGFVSYLHELNVSNFIVGFSVIKLLLLTGILTYLFARIRKKSFWRLWIFSGTLIALLFLTFTIFIQI